MKFLVVAFKDIKMCIRSLKFIFSIPLSSFSIIGLWMLFNYLNIHSLVITFPPILLMNLIFTLTLPCLGLAILFTNADILAKERSEGTILTLFSQPISNISIIMGKFTAILFNSLIYTFANILLLRILHPHLFEITGFVSESQLIISFFIAALIFELPIIGLTLLFSSILKRSATVTILVIIVYEALAILYSAQFQLAIGFQGHIPVPQNLILLIQVFIILLGSLLGHTLYVLSFQTQFTGISIAEPQVIKYLPINVNAQRIFNFLISPNPNVQTSEVIVSILSLIVITLLTLVLSSLVLEKVRSEYLD